MKRYRPTFPSLQTCLRAHLQASLYASDLAARMYKLLTSAQEHSVMYPVDLLKVRDSPWTSQTRASEALTRQRPESKSSIRRQVQCTAVYQMPWLPSHESRAFGHYGEDCQVL
jgi:hypothetical protein